MNLAQRLAYMANTAKFPWFGGWVSPNPQIGNQNGQQTEQPGGTVFYSAVVGGDQVNLDFLRVDNGGADLVIRSYVRKASGSFRTTIIQDLHVVGYGTDQEDVTFYGQYQPIRVGFIALADFCGFATAAGTLAALQSVSGSAAPVDVKAAVSEFLSEFQVGGQGIDIASPNFGPSLALLVAAGVFTQDQATALNSIPYPIYA